MSLDSLLASLENVTPITLRNTQALPQKPMWNKAVTLVTPVTSENIKPEKRLIQTFEHEAAIRGWLSEIGEPIEDHCLVLNKCIFNHEALIYFLKWAGKKAGIDNPFVRDYEAAEQCTADDYAKASKGY